MQIKPKCVFPDVIPVLLCSLLLYQLHHIASIFCLQSLVFLFVEVRCQDLVLLQMMFCLLSVPFVSYNSFFWPRDCGFVLFQVWLKMFRMQCFLWFEVLTFEIYVVCDIAVDFLLFDS